MPTQPFPNAILNKIKARQQAVRWSAKLKEVRTFSAYCCNINSDGIMGVAKQPVPIVDIGPNPVCLGESIDWDLTESYAPGSTISEWTINFGDGNEQTGANIATASGSHTYAAIGTYTVTITIEEGLGKTQETTREINVVDCTEPPITWMYAATDGQGVYYVSWTDDVPAWSARNTGLSGNALFVRSLVMKPGQDHVNPNSHELWAATRDGVYRTRDGGGSWEKITMPNPSNTEFGDSPAASVGELNWIHIAFDPNDPSIVYIEASKVVT